jgi:vacuolar protein sorting-associated protein 13A/C
MTKVCLMQSFLGSFVISCPTEHGVLFVKYCSILLQALTIQADEDFLYAVYELSKIRGASWEEEQRQ